MLLKVLGKKFYLSDLRGILTKVHFFITAAIKVIKSKSGNSFFCFVSKIFDCQISWLEYSFHDNFFFRSCCHAKLSPVGGKTNGAFRRGPCLHRPKKQANRQLKCTRCMAKLLIIKRITSLTNFIKQLPFCYFLKTGSGPDEKYLNSMISLGRLFLFQAL